MRIDKDLVAASATPLVLGILATGPSYGYAIQKQISELSGGRLSWADGMLYPLLHRLEAGGHIEATWGASKGGRRRKVYAITGRGLGQLESRREQWSIVAEALHQVWRAAQVAPPPPLPAPARTAAS
ncbi:MAG: helix-turn-helix transcriptional regulator [Bifidobacteriaceae bacterium]|nr:helix-turn-helix transcriptional regulator [Bifidobacteriaceae bacterium]